MSEDRSFAGLMARLRAGDDQAAAAVFHRFARRLIALAGRRLDPLTRRKADPEDVLQSVFRSFFVRYAAGQWDLGGWDELWGQLTVLTLRKCCRRVGHHWAARRDVRREAPLAEAGDDAAPGCEVLNREPTPEEAAQLAEQVELLLQPLPERDRQIVALRPQGYDIPETDARAGCSERTAHRVLAWARQRLLRLAKAGDAGGA